MEYTCGEDAAEVKTVCHRTSACIPFSEDLLHILACKILWDNFTEVGLKDVGLHSHYRTSPWGKGRNFRWQHYLHSQALKLRLWCSAFLKFSEVLFPHYHLSCVSFLAVFQKNVLVHEESNFPVAVILNTRECFMWLFISNSLLGIVRK